MYAKIWGKILNKGIYSYTLMAKCAILKIGREQFKAVETAVFSKEKSGKIFFRGKFCSMIPGRDRRPCVSDRTEQLCVLNYHTFGENTRILTYNDYVHTERLYGLTAGLSVSKSRDEEEDEDCLVDCIPCASQRAH